MKKNLFLISFFIWNAFLSKGQTGPCYFLTDTGTVDTETSESLVELSDGSVYVTGIQTHGSSAIEDAALLKFDKCGNVLWIKYFTDSLSIQGLYINKTADEKLILIGVKGNASNSNDIFLYKLDTGGNILLQQRYANSLNQSAKYIEQTSDKGFVFCGYVNDSYGNNDSYVIKTDSLGNIQWTQQIGGSGDEYANAVHETSDGNFIMVGDATSYGHGGTDVEVVKFNKNGYIIWDHTYGDSFNNGSQGIIEVSKGRYLTFGETEIAHFSPFDFFMDMIDTNGTDLGRHTFGGSATDALFSLTEAPGLQFICTGYSRSYNGLQAYDIVVFKVDTAGNIKWLNNIYNPGIDIGYEILPSLFGGYLVTGLFATDNTDYVLIKSDTIGNVTLGINTQLVNNEINVYPNPTGSTLFISSDHTSIEKILIFDMLGKKVLEVYKNSTDTAEINISTLATGPYLLQIITSHETFYKKIYKD